MSIEEVERIMDETQDAIEYQRVSQGTIRDLRPFQVVSVTVKHCFCVCAANRRHAGWFAIAGGRGRRAG